MLDCQLPHFWVLAPKLGKYCKTGWLQLGSIFTVACRKGTCYRCDLYLHETFSLISSLCKFTNHAINRRCATQYNKFNVFSVLSCGFVCELPANSTADEITEITHTQSYDIRLRSHLDAQQLVYRHSVSHLIPRTITPKRDQSTSRIMKNDPFLNTTVTRISEREVFFPAPRLYRIVCTHNASNATCSFGTDNVLDEFDDENEQVRYRVRITHDAQKSAVDVRNYYVQAVSTGNLTKDDDYDGVDTVTCQDQVSFTKTCGLCLGLRRRKPTQIVSLSILR